MNSKLNILTIGKYILVAIIVLFMILLFTTRARESYPVINKIILDSVSKYIDENHNLRSQIKIHEFNDDRNNTIIDSLARIIRIKPKNIKNVTVIENKVDTTVTSITNIIGDSIYTFTKKDRYIDLYVRLGKDTGSASLLLTDSLTITEISKHRLFRTDRYIDINHTNPYFITNKAVSYGIHTKTPVVTIGPSIGVGYDIYTNRFIPTIGISIQIPIVKIR